MTNDEKWSAAAICICSEGLSAKEITEVLNVQPSSSFEKGTLCSPRNPNSMVRKGSVWTLESSIDDCLPLSDHINALLPFIEEKYDQLKILSKSCYIELFCGYSSGSGTGRLVLEADILIKLTLIPLTFVLDLYPPGDDCLINGCDGN